MNSRSGGGYIRGLGLPRRVRRHVAPLLTSSLMVALIISTLLYPRLLCSQTTDMPDFRKIVNGAKQKVFPAVVFIKCVQENFESGDKSSREVAGSGVLISSDGEVLSNWHVVEKAKQVRCLLYDGQAFDARVLGSDKDVDIALLRLELPAGTAPLPAAVLGDSRLLTEGDFVMAMGAPWGLTRSVSIGIVSCIKRYLPEGSEYSCWLQTDAAISPGNSGGPLVNTAGEVVGINTRGAMIGGDMGFAIPIDVAREVADQIRTSGKMDWSWTGLQFQPLKDFHRNMYFPATNGVMVAETDPDSPALRAGLKSGDRIVSVNGQAVTALTEEDVPAMRRKFGLLAKGTAATVELVRQGKPLTVELTPRAKGKVEGDCLECPRWDLTVKAINQFDNPDLYFLRSEGVFIFSVKMPGNAASSGLGGEDILLKIDGVEVKTLDDVKRIHKATLADANRKKRVVLTLLQNGLMKQVVLDYARNYEKE